MSSTARATSDPYLDPLPPLVSESAMPSAPRAIWDPYLDPCRKRKRAIHTSWTKREPRKRRPQTFRPPGLRALLGRRAMSRAFTSRQKIGLRKPGMKNGPPRFVPNAANLGSVGDMARRLVVGRSEPLLLQLMGNIVFKGKLDASFNCSLDPARGLFTNYLGEPQFIANTVYRYNQCLLDLVGLQKRRMAFGS